MAPKASQRAATPGNGQQHQSGQQQPAERQQQRRHIFQGNLDEEIRQAPDDSQSYESKPSPPSHELSQCRQPPILSGQTIAGGRGWNQLNTGMATACAAIEALCKNADSVAAALALARIFARRAYSLR